MTRDASAVQSTSAKRRWFLTLDDDATGRLLWQVTHSVAGRGGPCRRTARPHARPVHAAWLAVRPLPVGTRPGQRELADFAGLEPIYVSKLIRAPESAGMVVPGPTSRRPASTTPHPHRQGHGGHREAMTVVHAFQDELTTPIGGNTGPRSRELVRTLQALLDPSGESERMTENPVLTG